MKNIKTTLLAAVALAGCSVDTQGTGDEADGGDAGIPGIPNDGGPVIPTTFKALTAASEFPSAEVEAPHGFTTDRKPATAPSELAKADLAVQKATIALNQAQAELNTVEALPVVLAYNKAIQDLATAQANYDAAKAAFIAGTGSAQAAADAQTALNAATAKRDETTNALNADTATNQRYSLAKTSLQVAKSDLDITTKDRDGLAGPPVYGDCSATTTTKIFGEPIIGLSACAGIVLDDTFKCTKLPTGSTTCVGSKSKYAVVDNGDATYDVFDLSFVTPTKVAAYSAVVISGNAAGTATLKFTAEKLLSIGELFCFVDTNVDSLAQVSQVCKK